KDGITFREQGPRPLDTPDGRIDFHNLGDTVVHNVCAFNHGYQLGLWFDNGFFGWHPAERKKYNSESAYQAYLNGHPDLVYDPAKQGLILDHNLYFAGSGEKTFLYGVPWRPKYREFGTLAAFTAATGFDAHSE